MRAAPDGVGATIAAASDRNRQGLRCSAVEQRERRARVNQRLDRPLPVPMIEAEVDRGPSDVDDLAAGRDDPLFRPVRKGVEPIRATNYPAPTMKLLEGGATN